MTSDNFGQLNSSSFRPTLLNFALWSTESPGVLPGAKAAMLLLDSCTIAER